MSLENPFLTLFDTDLPDLSAVPEAISLTARESGYSCSGPYKLWKHDERIDLADGFSYVHGFELTPFDHTRIVVSSRYFFFEPGAELPSRFSFTDFLDEGRIPKVDDYPIRIERILKLMQEFSLRQPAFSSKPVVPIQIWENLRSFTQVETSISAPQNCDTKMSINLKNGGLYRSPHGFMISIVAPPDRTAVAGQLREEFTRSFRDLKIEVAIECHSENLLEKSLAEFESRKSGPTPGHVTFIGVSGRKGDYIPENIERCLVTLDRHRIPYRLFSLDNQNFRWSVLDMSIIAVQLAGGIPYRVRLPLGANLPNPVFIGFDMGHPKDGESVVVGTAVDRFGSLLAYWEGRQPRDETLSEKCLRDALKFLTTVLRKRFPDGYQPVIIRDGRMFENESLYPYEEAFQGGFSFIEVRKSGVPLFCDGLNLVPPGTACRIPNHGGLVLLAHYGNVRTHQLNPIRIDVVRNGHGIDELELLKIVTGLCYAPILGLLPSRIPAPIYWADGIAGNNPINHQFRGLHFVNHN